MYMTRDNSMESLITFWNTDSDINIYKSNTFEEWFSDTIAVLFECTPKAFKQLFPKQKLPRKGSCKWVEFRLYIPGEG